MMLAYLLAPSFQCVDVNGKPLTGGYIQSFLTGTVTQAITYSDFSGTQNASQVTLDSKGMATIIAESLTALDVYCYNASGVLQWSRMNVTPGSGGGSSQTLIFDPMPTEGSFNPVYSNGIYAAIKNEASARASADASLQNFVLQNTSDNQKTWYLDTVNGLDTNSGLSRSAPKKTGDAVVIACKAAGKSTGRLVVMTGTDAVTFTAANWATATFPFFDVVFETASTECIWNEVGFYTLFKVVGGVHTFNSCTSSGGEIIVKAKTSIVNGGTWSGLINFDLETYMIVNGMASMASLRIQASSLEIHTVFMIEGPAKIQVNELWGAGSVQSYSNSTVYLDVQTNLLSLEGNFSFPSQTENSSIKITAAKMHRAATTKLLYLGANTGVTVNYQLVVDTMGSIVPMEIANPAGTVAGKVIELLKYEDKVDAEIVRATAAEALERTSADNAIIESISNSVVLGYEEIIDLNSVSSVDGSISASAVAGCSSYIDCLGLPSVMLTMPIYASSSTDGIAFYNSSKVFISGVAVNTGTVVGIETRTINVPTNAVYFRTTFWNYANAATYGSFVCNLIYPVGFLGYGKYRPNQSGQIHFSVEVNQKVSNFWDATSANQELADLDVTTGVLVLPDSYTKDGKPTKIIMYCHGLSRNVSYTQWSGNDAKALAQKEYWRSQGFAVFDCNGPNNNGGAALCANGAPQSVNAYRQSFEYIRDHYNIDPEIYVIAGSSGGLVGLNYCFSYNNIRALALLSAWTSNYYCGWGQGVRTPYVSFFGFANTTTYEPEKVSGFDPLTRISTIDSVPMLHYMKHPVKLWIGSLESASVLYRYAIDYITALRNAKSDASTRIVDGADHSLVSGGNAVVNEEVSTWLKKH